MSDNKFLDEAIRKFEEEHGRKPEISEISLLGIRPPYSRYVDFPVKISAEVTLTYSPLDYIDECVKKMTFEEYLQEKDKYDNHIIVIHETLPSLKEVWVYTRASSEA
jgi:hypothetical protein